MASTASAPAPAAASAAAAAAAAPAASLGSLLPGAVAELAAATLGPSAATLTALDNAVEAHLARIDDASGLVEGVRAQIQQTADAAFPALLQNARELEALYGVLDRAEESAGRGLAAARAAAERLEQLQAGYDQRYPEGMAKAMAWFGGAKARVADAPVKLPPFDAASARIDAAAEIAALQAAVGVSGAVREIAGFAEGDGGAAGGGGDDEAAGDAEAALDELAAQVGSAAASSARAADAPTPGQ